MVVQAIETGLDILEAVIAASTPNSNLSFISASESKDKIQFYLEKLFQFEPKIIGGALPDDDCYYLSQ